MKTCVVNIKCDEYDVYVGRAVPRMGLSASPWGNPFRVGMTWMESRKLLVSTGVFEVEASFDTDGVLDRDDAINCHRAWFMAQPKLIARARRELKGKRLACFCAPARCHADNLVEAVEWEVT